MLRAAVAQVIAVDAGDDDVRESQRGDGAREIDRLVGVGRQRPAVRDVAERAAARAQIAEDHERRRALAEALADVRARRFLAHRVQTVLAQACLTSLKRLPSPRRTRIHARLLQALGRHDLESGCARSSLRPSA